MSRNVAISLGTALAVTLATVVLWQATGGDYYTKFEVVEQVKQTVDEEDPLAAAGFYDDAKSTETVVRDEFRFGLLPTPNNLIDKHLLSVASVTTPTWIMALLYLWISRRKRSGSAG